MGGFPVFFALIGCLLAEGSGLKLLSAVLDERREFVQLVPGKLEGAAAVASFQDEIHQTGLVPKLMKRSTRLVIAIHVW